MKRKIFKVLICGDRDWTDYESIKSVILSLIKEHGGIIIVEGEADGADSIARDVGLELKQEVRGYPASWEFGKPAGVFRNQKMLDFETPDMVIAFHKDLSKSRGTRDMIIRAAKAKIPYKIYNE